MDRKDDMQVFNASMEALNVVAKLSGMDVQELARLKIEQANINADDVWQTCVRLGRERDLPPDMIFKGVAAVVVANAAYEWRTALVADARKGTF